jgi:ABC-type nitrate/sulfonate/bicarbonate transport system permease component
MSRTLADASAMTRLQRAHHGPDRPGPLTWLVPFLLVGLLLGAWELLVRGLDIAAYLLPAPSVIAEKLATEHDILLANLRVTIVEMLLGFALACVTAIPLGIALGYSRIFRQATLPVLVASQTIPIIAVAPVLTIWFGYDLTPKVLITALICFFPLTINAAAGFSARDSETERLFRALGASWRQRFAKLAVPTALPYIFTGMRISVTLSVIGATVSEWAGANSGLGHLILIDTGQLDTVRVFAAITVLSLTGIALFTAVALLERLLTPWRHRTRRQRRRTQPIRSLSGG